MTLDNSDFLCFVVIALYIYLISKEWEQVDSRHLALRSQRKLSEPEQLAEEDRSIVAKALLHKHKAVAEYRTTHHVSLSCAQEIVETILREGAKAQSK
jgi:hypothetical protein